MASTPYRYHPKVRRRWDWMTPSVLWKSANAQTLLPSIICIRLMLPIYTYPMRNMVPNIVYSARGEEVVLSVVNGKIVMKDRKLVNVDEMEHAL